MEKAKANIHYVDFREAFRLYDPRHPQQTIAYVDSVEEAEQEGYELTIEEPVVTGYSQNWIEEALGKAVRWSPVCIGKRGGLDEYLITFADGSENTYHIFWEERLIEEA